MLNFEWYQEDSVAFELPNGGQLRITCGVCSEYDLAIYRAYLGQAQDYLAEEYQLDFAAIARGAARMNGHFHEWDALRDWAANMAALRKIEQRADADAAWESVEAPAEWRAPATGLRAIPGTIMRAWNQLVNDLNPGMFSTLVSDTAKKNVRLIETPSTSASTPSSTPKTRRKRN